MRKWLLLVVCMLALPAGAAGFVQSNESQQQARDYLINGEK